MKTRIIFLALSAIMMTACASYEGRKVASTQDKKGPVEYSKLEAQSGRDFRN